MNLAREILVACARTLHALDGEPIVIDGPANLQRGWEAAGGFLALSKDWLAFTPHRLNYRIGRVLIPTAAIQRAWPCWTWVFGLLPLFPNSVAVKTTGGRVYRFVVADRQTWAAALRCLRD